MGQAVIWPHAATAEAAPSRRRPVLSASGAGAIVQLDLDPMAATVATDAERLRIALVNMLVNARHAVNGQESSVTSHQSSVVLRTRVNGDRVTITVADEQTGEAFETLVPRENALDAFYHPFVYAPS